MTLLAPTRFLVPALLALAGPLAAMDWPNVDVHGFVSQGYLLSSENNFVQDTRQGTLAFNEVGLNVGSQVTDHLRVGAQIFAYDLGNYGNNEVLIDWAYGDYRHNDLLGVRLGRYKLPVGLYNEMLDLDLAFTSVLLPQAVYDARYREMFGGLNGVQLYGLLSLGKAGSLEYQGYVGTTNIDNDGYLADQFQQGSQGFEVVNRLDFGTSGGVNLNYRPPLQGLRLNTYLLYAHELNVHGTMEPMPGVNLDVVSSSSGFYLGGAGFEYTAERLTLASEYRITYADVDIDVDTSPLGGGIVREKQQVRSDGAYFLTAYRLNESWEIGSYYGIFWGNRNDRDGDRFAALGQDRSRAWQRDLALTVRWDVNEAWIVKVEGHYIDGTSMLSTEVNPGGFERHWFMFAAKTTLSF